MKQFCVKKTPDNLTLEPSGNLTLCLCALNADYGDPALYASHGDPALYAGHGDPALHCFYIAVGDIMQIYEVE